MPQQGMIMRFFPFDQLSRPPGYLVLPAPAEMVHALLARIDRAEQDWGEQAAVAALDPTLAFDLLVASPGAARSGGFDLRSHLARIMASLGPDLLRAWCLDKLALPRGGPDPGIGLRESLHGLFVGELAVHLAVELHQGALQEAYAAGLLHDVGRLWFAHHAAPDSGGPASYMEERALSTTEWERFGVPHAGFGAVLVSACGLPAPLLDAIDLHHCPAPAIADAAPLARLVWLAEEIAGPRFEVSDHDLGTAAQVSGLEVATLSGLRLDVARRLASLTKHFGIPAAGVRGADGAAPSDDGGGRLGGWSRDDPVAAASVSALARGALMDMGDGDPPRFAAACRLLLDLGTPLLLELDAASGELRGLGDDERPWATQVRISPSRGSILAHGHEVGGSRQSVFGTQGPEHSAADWELARRLGASGLLCETWSHEARRGVAVFGLPGAYRDDRIRAAARAGLVGAAIAARLRRQRMQTVRREAQQELRAHYSEHYRRLAHEVTNPLTVIKTYLGVIRQRGTGNPPLDGDFDLLDKELDRVTAMVRGMALPPDAPAETDDDTVEVGGLLEELRRLYAEPLFAARGVAFEIHAGCEQHHAHISRDALKQVLLNLFKNASEALQPGRRFCVSLIPTVNVGGVRCLGIRIADDGGGIAPEAMRGLFERAHTSKGGPHQGLGLVVVREILARHGASIVCESDTLTGTVFHVYIPLAEPI